ncbi:hypothetical protein [uncultured Ruminococcus sp.]|uniref:hypothetical protein n=1 Tax=uncultured Ruminococcus sp. TaxID=165186 RepID=UPI00343CC9E8
MEVTFEQSFILSNGEQKYKPTDCEQLAELFYNTVHSTNAKNYTEEHLNVWSTSGVDYSFLKHKTVVTIKNGAISVLEM